MYNKPFEWDCFVGGVSRNTALPYACEGKGNIELCIILGSGNRG